MTQISYTYSRQRFDRYIFISIGRKRIIKAVDFSLTSVKGLYNIGFGDLLPNGSMDDKVNSNNGDIFKVLSTIAQIIRDFTAEFPNAKIVFTGSTNERTKLYGRILRMYYQEFRKEFIISAFVKTATSLKEVEFDPDDAFQYYAFFIKRIH